MSAAGALVARAIAAHGGPNGLARLDGVQLELAHLGGLVPWLKGLDRTWPAFGRARVWPAERRAEFTDYPEPGARIRYDRGRVARDDEPFGAPHRDQLRVFRRWRPEDAVYFFGYALVTYLSVPFVLPALEHLKASDRWLWVRFPDDWHTHCPVQRFWFAPDGTLQRHDYHADVLGPLFYGAHFTSDYTRHNGVLVARRRQVFGCVGPYRHHLRTPVSVLDARLRVNG